MRAIWQRLRRTVMTAHVLATAPINFCVLPLVEEAGKFTNMARKARQCCQVLTVPLSCIALLLLRAPAVGFTLFNDRTDLPADEAAAFAARWNAAPPRQAHEPSLGDAIQVGVAPDLLAQLGIAEEVARHYGIDVLTLQELSRRVVQDGVRAWEHGALRFEIVFDALVVPGSPREGFEIDLYVGEAGTFFGWTAATWRYDADRLLTNGLSLPGNVIEGADITINRDRVAEAARALMAIGQPLDILAAAFQVLITHEVGHAIGLGHPNEGRFLDTDSDPLNVMVIDPRDPFRDLQIWPNPRNPPIAAMPLMWGGLSQTDPASLLNLLRRLRNPSLAPDDIAGRDVLYPALDSPSPTPTRTATPTPTARATLWPTASVTPTVMLPTPTPTAVSCSGDCNEDGSVTVDEIVLLVNIALEHTQQTLCSAGDRNGDRRITIDEIVLAVRVALLGCQGLTRFARFTL